jgi:diguanylate cyclase (GGDEF)-like protein/putative nucleotidyltransferase with HDIG domain
MSLAFSLAASRGGNPSVEDSYPTFSSLPGAARALVAAVVLGAIALLAYRLPRLEITTPLLFFVLLLLSGIASLLRVNVPLSQRGSTMSLSYAVDFVSLLLIGQDAAMLIAAAGALSQCTLGRQADPWYRTVYSMATLLITVQAAGLVYVLAGGVPSPVAENIIGIEKPLVASATTYFLVNSLLVVSAVALTTNHGLRAIWGEEFLWSALSYFVGAGAAAVGALLMKGTSYWLAPLMIAPLYLTYRAYKVYIERLEGEQRHVRELSELHLATIEALALAIDAKDQTATSHIRRVQVYAAGLAEALGMSPTDVQGVRTAALLHDIGKLAVPEHILSKPGPLTPEEFQKIQVHPQIGAEIIGGVPFPYPVAPLILAHHEKWDGNGYPRGLKGDAIPLGARILAVVDHFDALTSERPYHAALSVEDALKTIRDEAGQALDPRIVDLFLRLLPDLEAEARRVGEPARRLSFAPGADGARPAVGFAHEPEAKDVFHDIARAHREIYALYEIAQSMSTTLGLQETMQLVASKLSNLVPFASCALFLRSEDDECLRCSFATGVDAELLERISLPLGAGLAGWVARNHRPLVNARPSADFEAAGLTVETRLNAALVCPLVANERLIGALALYDEQPGRFTDDHRRLLDRVCEQAGVVVHNSIVFEQTRRDSLTDPLTGLSNARSMATQIARELARAERLTSEVTIFVMDLDGFKGINDKYGHHIGDLALREVARTLRAGIRPYDMCARYAGDEFVVALAGCGPEEGELKRLELQSAIEAIPFEVRPGRVIKLGSSFGSASYPRDGEGYESLLAIADRRMYEDKARRKGGQNAREADPPVRIERSVFAKIDPPSTVSRPH